MVPGKKEWLNRVVLTFVSLAIALLMVEFLCHFLLDPIDFLIPEIENDDVLGIRIRPYSAGHDAWGFRNESVPATSEIVAIGDSQTYGNSAAARYSWPAWLERISGRQVYNLSLGGYDPVDYYYLLEHYGLKLKPRQVIVGFYFGNDLSEAFRKIYSRDHWAGLRNPDFAVVEDIRFKTVDTTLANKKFLGGLRRWLARRSFLYRISTALVSPWIKTLLGGKRRGAPLERVYEDQGKGIYSAFKPQERLGALDLDDRRIREGLRITLEVLHRIDDLCKSNGVGLTVLLIPTKERVYAKFIENNEQFGDSELIGRLLRNEGEISSMIKGDLVGRGIRCLDVSGPLQKAVSAGRGIYPPFDGHPNRYGYEIIAREVGKILSAAGTK